MVSNYPSLLERARQGDIQAINSVIDYLIADKGIQSSASLTQGCLHINLQAEIIPDQERSVRYIQKILATLHLKAIERVKLYGKRKGSTFLAWKQELHLKGDLEQSFWDCLTQQTAQVNSAVSKSVVQTTKEIKDQVMKAGEAFSNATLQTSQSIAKGVNDLGELSQNSVVQQSSQSVSETMVETGESISAVTLQATHTVSEQNSSEQKIATNMNQILDFSKVPENERIAFYGALFAIAFADDSVEKEEVELIFGVMDLEGMSEAAKREVHSYIIEPPSLWSCLKALEEANENLRYSLMVNIVDTAWANDEVDSNEEEAIVLAQRILRVTEEQLTAIKSFIRKVREIRIRGLDDNQAADAMKTATAGLSAVGVPIAAVYLSGSVIGLSAAGITSGLAGLGTLVGLGGMVPGIGVAVLLGTGIFMGVNALLDTGDRSKKAQFQAEKERKAQLVIQNLQQAINGLIERIATLQEKAATADANREAIAILTERLRCLQKLVERRKTASGAV